MDLASLKRRVTRALVRDDIDPEELSAWVRSATKRLDRDLRVKENLSHRVLPLTTARFAAPSDFLEVREISLHANPAGAINQGRALGPLQWAAPAEIQAMAAAYTGAPGVPGYFTVRGNEIEVSPFVGSNAQISLWYFAKLKPLAKPEDTNPALEEFEELYLGLTMVFGHRFYLEKDEALVREGLASQEISRLNEAFEAAKYGDGPLTVRPPQRIGGRFS